MSKDLQTLAGQVRGWWQQIQFATGAIDSFKTSMAAVLCLWLGNLFGLTHAYWAAISAIVVMAQMPA